MPQERKPASHKPSAQSAIKSRHRRYRKNHSNTSLRDFVQRECLTQSGKPDDELRLKAEAWLFNKRANFSKPPLGLGSTRKKKGQQKK